MTTSKFRKILTMGVGVTAGVMTLASTAYACTSYRGDMTFTNASGSQTVTGDGIWGNMGWCGGAPAFTLTAPAFANTTITGITSAISSNAAACPGTPDPGSTFPTDRLRADTYSVTVAGGFMGQNATPKHINCHGQGGAKNIGSFTVTGTGGVGSGGPYTYKSSRLAVGWDNICVWGTTTGNSDANDINIAAV